MFKRLILASLLSLASLLGVSQAANATTYSACLRLNIPVPGDPTVANIWGTLLNTNFTLLDTASGGTGTISVAGSSNVVLTANSGAADQSRSANFVFTGALTGNINVLFPQGGCGSFSVKNSTSGAFTLSIGANNGSGSPVGAVTIVPQGGTLELVSDGTNVRQREDIIGLGAAARGVNSDITALTALSSPLSILQSIGANSVLGNWTGSSAAVVANTVPVCVDAGGSHLNYVNGVGITCGTSGGATGAAWRSNRVNDVSLSSNTIQEIVMDHETFDTANICSTGTGRCTPTLAGKYRVTCMLAVSGAPSSAGDIVARSEILLNGSPVLINDVTSQVSTGGFRAHPQTNDIVSVNGTTDYISCAAFQNTGGVPSILGGTTLTAFSGSFVGQ